MIVFDLQCANGHLFEGWFEDSGAYDHQQARGLISCPVCNDTHVTKIPSTFAIKTAAPMAAEPKAGDDTADIGQKLAQFVRDNFDDVGSDFAKEALKIHYGAAEPRNIRGSSSSEEEKTLEKEGVKFFKIPLPAGSESDA